MSDTTTGLLWVEKAMSVFGADATDALLSAREDLEAAGFDYPTDPCTAAACDAYAALFGADELLDMLDSGVSLEDTLA